MIRRLAAVLLMCALRSDAGAKTLIVTGGTIKPGQGIGYDIAEQAALTTRAGAITTILDAFGATYKTIPAAAMRTEWARTGVVTWNFGTSSAYTESFDAVIHLAFVRKNMASPNYPSYRPDSLTLASKLPLVPQLMLPAIDAASNSGLADVPSTMISSTACSTGTRTSIGLEGICSAGGGTGSHDEEGSLYSPRTGRYFSGLINQGHATLSHAMGDAKGMEVLLAQSTASAWRYNLSLFTPSCWDCPIAIQPPTTVDTAMVWMMRNTHKSTAKPIIYAKVSDTIGDGSEGLILPNESIDYTVLMVALAALDSASGGLVFDNKVRLPLRVGIGIDGLCSRSSGTNSGGFLPSDSSAFYASVDSIAALNVPVVFGVNLDSMSTYSRDLQYVKFNCPKCLFTPQTRAGLDTSASFAPEQLQAEATEAGSVGGNNRKNRPVDTFRRYRNQSMAVGPVGTSDADTSLYASLSYAIFRGDSTWGYERSSRFAMPPDDDWSPYNLRAQQVDPSRGVTVDSILYAYAKAGFRGIRMNSCWTAYRPRNSPSNPRGFIFRQGKYDVCGSTINLVGDQGGSTYGNLMFDVQPDSTAPLSSDPGQSIGWSQAGRFWNGIFGYVRNQYSDTYSGSTGEENTTAEQQAVRVFRLTAQNLAGANGDYRHFVRPGWYSIRAIVEPIEIMNQVAGRSIMQVSDPARIVLP